MTSLERPLRVLLVSSAPNNPLGGASRVFHLLESGLRERGHEVRLLHREDMPNLLSSGRISQRFLLPQIVSRDVAREEPEKFDVIMSPSGILYPLYQMMARNGISTLRVNHLLGAAFFDHQATLDEAARGHQKLSPQYRLVTGPSAVRWDKLGSRAADMTTVNCRRDLDYLLDQGVPEGQCRWIPLAVHPAVLAARSTAGRAPLRMPLSAIWFGSWSDRKGIHYLPRAWAKVLATYPDAILTIGGTGMEEGAVLAQFAGMDVSGIRVLGHVSIDEQVRQFERHAVFLFPSLSEGFGFALLEAMACGLASVTTATGLGGDLLCDRDNAIIIPSASSLHLSEAVIALFANPARLAQIGNKAKERGDQFGVERLVEEYENMFREVIKFPVHHR